jgi:hypothetical protein
VPSRRRRQHGGCLSIEAHDVAQQLVVLETHHVSRLGEETGQTAAAVLKARRWTRHREGHVRRLRADVQLLKKADEIRIGLVVVDEEACIEGDAALRRIDPDRVGMSAETSLRLEERHHVTPANEIRCREPGDPGADHRDALHAARLDARSTNGRKSRATPIAARPRSAA